jgi:predicted DNA-binding protein
MEWKRLELRLDPETHGKLEALKAQTERSYASLIREGIREVVKRIDRERAKSQRRAA